METDLYIYMYTMSSLRSSPSFAYVHNLAPDSSLCRLQSCSPIASASAAARRLRPLQLLLPGPIAASASTAAPPLPPLPAAAPRLCPLHLLLVTCIRFSCCSRSHPLRLLLPDCVRFNCCSPDYVCFDCCSLIALAGFQPMPGPKVLEHSSQSSRFSK